MASPITFGVELEFNLAWVMEQNPLPYPTETRQLRFPFTDEVMVYTRKLRSLQPDAPIPMEDRGSSVDSFDHDATRRAAQCSIRDKLTSIGCKVDIEQTAPPPTVWEVGLDESVEPPIVSPYLWCPIEVKSPALPFTPDSLDTIMEVCNLLTREYVTLTDWSAGLHVHVAAGDKTFSFQCMRKLFAFLWAFEPQLHTLHPKNRQKSKYCHGLREASRMAVEFGYSFGSNPTALQAIGALFNCRDLESLLSQVEDKGRNKFMTYNSGNALDFVKQPGGFHKPTIEFRQHEGTLDGERVSQWVKLIAGLVQRLETIHPESLLDLLKLAKNEKWEKTQSDAENSKNESKFGPVLAESTLTIIDILEYLGMQESADYYRDRLYLVAGQTKEKLPPIAKWQVAGTNRNGEQGGLMGLIQSLILAPPIMDESGDEYD